MNKNLKIILINQNNIYEKDFKIIYKIVKSENKLAIISRLSYRLFKKFLLQITKSNKIYLFTLKKADKLIGYAIFSENPNQSFTFKIGGTLEPKQISKFYFFTNFKVLLSI